MPDILPRFDERQATRRRRVIRSSVRRTLSKAGVDDRAAVAALVTTLVTITPPQVPPPSLDFVTYDNVTGTATSLKPGNVVFNLRKFMFAVMEGVAGVAGSATVPWVAVLCGIVALNNVLEAVEQELGPNEALVLLALWDSRDARRCVRRREIATLVNAALAARKRRR